MFDSHAREPIGGRAIYQEPLKITKFYVFGGDSQRDHLQRFSVPKDPPDPAVLQARYRVGRNLRDIRDWRNLTQQNLGEITGMSDKQVSRIETGVSSPGLDHLVRLALGLHVPLFWLFTTDWPRFIGDESQTPSRPPAP